MGSGTISRLTMCAFLGIEKPQTTANIRVRIHGPKSRLNSWIFRIPTARTCAGLSGFRGLKPATTILLAASRHISSATASDSQHLQHPASHESRDNERRAGPSHGRHGSRRWSVPADCGRYRGCRLLLQSHWSGAHVQLCEGPNSASLASTYIREYTRLFSADIPAKQDYSSCT